MACLFCEIVSGLRPATVVYRDALCLVFMDIFPVQPGHALVVPARHAGLIEELSGDERAHLFETAVRILRAQKRAGLGEAINLQINDGKAANQHIPHVHLHLVPRKSGDTIPTVFRFLSRGFDVFGKEKQLAALTAAAERIRQELQGTGEGTGAG